MTGWADLETEIDAWSAAGRTVDLWLRDDDAGTATAPLWRLAEMCGRYRVPPSLAAIPTRAARDTAEALAGLDGARVLVHGFAHADRSGAGERKTEYPATRAPAEVVAEWGRALGLTRDIFGALAMAVFVPPWNRMAAALQAHLPQAGFAGLSGFGGRGPERRPGLAIANVHVDVVDWRRRAFRGQAATLARLVGHLEDRRTGRADVREATGIMTHHRDLDEDCWSFLDRLLASTHRRPDVRWLSAAEIFGAAA